MNTVIQKDASTTADGPRTSVPEYCRQHAMATAVGLTLLVVLLAAAISVDVVRAGYKTKSDESTYVSMTFSLAYDRDLVYERRDLERYWATYEGGPEGIFLKRGKQLRFKLMSAPPFVQLTKTIDPRSDRLYFGKAMLYPMVAAPFVWIFGINGFLVLHVFLLAIAGACGYAFMVTRSRQGPALSFTLAFLFASVLPVYTVFLMPEALNYTLVFVAYFSWLYKEVATARSPLLAGNSSDIVAAVLLGMATYSKPIVAPLIVPIVLLRSSREQWKQGVVVAVAFLLVLTVLFGANAAVTGEFNYQGGDRKTFYTARDPAPPGRGFPFEGADATWENRGERVATDELGAENALKATEIIRLFGNNVKYFLIGRHYGLLPYFFPALAALLAWAVSRDRFRPWKVLTLTGALATTLALLIVLPYTWSGGGGPPGNRYFLSIYPTLFFLMPPIESFGWPLLAWAGGAMFIAKMLVNPFYAAKFTWEATERGFARRLPVELTMYRDLPVMLDPMIRGQIPYGNPRMLLYFLDHHAFPPEPNGIWVAANGRADIVVHAADRIDRFTLTAYSPVRTTFTVSAGRSPMTVAIAPDTRVTFSVDATSVRSLTGYTSLLSARSSDGFTPHLRDPQSDDWRNLGVQMNFTTASNP
jgi:hypothetical protein